MQLCHCRSLPFLCPSPSQSPASLVLEQSHHPQSGLPHPPSVASVPCPLILICRNHGDGSLDSAHRMALSRVTSLCALPSTLPTSEASSHPWQQLLLPTFRYATIPPTPTPRHFHPLTYPALGPAISLFRPHWTEH